MAPFGTLHTLAQATHPRTRPALAVAKITGRELIIPQDFAFGTTNKTPEYLDKFPLGKIPAFEGADGFLLTESMAIAHYLADMAPDETQRAQLLGATPSQRALVIKWMFFTQEHLIPALVTTCIWRLGFVEYDATKEPAAVEKLGQWLDYIEAHLSGRTWLVDQANGPSLADLILASQMFVAYSAYVDAAMRSAYPCIGAWYERLRTLPVLHGIFDVNMVEVRKPVPE